MGPVQGLARWLGKALNSGGWGSSDCIPKIYRFVAKNAPIALDCNFTHVPGALQDSIESPGRTPEPVCSHHFISTAKWA